MTYITSNKGGDRLTAEYEPRRALPDTRSKTEVTVDYVLARMKAVIAFIGAVLTFATGLPVLGLPVWVSGVAAVCTFIGVYVVPNRKVPPAI